MPHLITRAKALEQLQSEGNGSCLICGINASPVYLLHEGEFSNVVLSQYPRQWGQVMVNLRRHITSVSEINEEEWMEMSRLAFKAARIIEQVLQPARCYIASIGAVNNLPMTSPHLHINVMPVYDAAHKPSEIFTWEHGLYSGTKDEWNELYDRLRTAWNKL